MIILEDKGNKEDTTFYVESPIIKIKIKVRVDNNEKRNTIFFNNNFSNQFI